MLVGVVKILRKLLNCFDLRISLRLFDTIFLKNDIKDFAFGVFLLQKIRDDRRVTDPEKWIISENHHEPIIDRKTFDKVQERFQKSGRKWKRRDHHVLVGRVKCGCCGHNLRHSTSVGQPYY